MPKVQHFGQPHIFLFLSYNGLGTFPRESAIIAKEDRDEDDEVMEETFYNIIEGDKGD